VCAESEPCLSDDDLTNEMAEMQSQVIGVSNVVDECQFVHNDYAKLQYVDVKISDQNCSDVKVLSGINDGGAEISAVHTSVTRRITHRKS